MRVQITQRFVVALMAAVLLTGVSPLPASATPPSGRTAADQARLDSALRKLEAARTARDTLDERVASTTGRLDRIIADQQRTRARLTARSRTMYRSGNTSLVEVLMGAASFEDLATRWDLLKRMNRQDAQDLERLAEARKAAEKAARSLLVLQAQRARSVDALDREVSTARRQLSASQSALATYNARAAAARKVATSRVRSASRKKDSTQQLRGSGEWKSAKASHYGRNFSGRGASGERIGPYSMIVAHKTLPFGTLIEFEYKGKRAVAKVADRGPHVAGRVFDLGPGVVRALDFAGVDTVKYRVIGR